MKNVAAIALSQLTAMRREMDIIANNIANANTTAFKAEHLLFSEYLQPLDDGGTMSLVRDAEVIRDISEGTFTSTGNPFDVALRGDGYFEVETPAGRRYTRNGHFQLDEQGRIVTTQGYLVLSDAGDPIFTLPGDADITISPDGVVSTPRAPLGRLSVVTFDDPRALGKAANGLYDTRLEPMPFPDMEVVQGMIEQSNVQPIVEMTRMIKLVRAYQATQRLLQQDDDVRRRAITTIARIDQ